MYMYIHSSQISNVVRCREAYVHEVWMEDPLVAMTYHAYMMTW